MRITGCQYWDPKTDRRPLVICLYCSVPDADLHIPMDTLNRGSERVDDLAISNFESLDNNVVLMAVKRNNGLHINPGAGGTLTLDISAIPCFDGLSNCELSLAFWVVTFELWGKAGEKSSNFFNVNGWHHLALTWKSTSNTATVKYYLDGASHHMRSFTDGMPLATTIDRDHIKYGSDGVSITVDDLYLWG